MTKARVWQIIRNVVLVLLGLVAAFFVIFVPWFFTQIATTRQFHYPDPNDGKSPKSYGMDWKIVQFRSIDGIRLKGWYIPASGAAKGTIIYCHGLNRTRIEMLPKAAFGHELGYNGLLFDFRHQGASEGAMTTLGFKERFDVLGAVHYALNDEKAARPIVLWGVSMGAAAALLAAAESPDVAAVISDSSFLSLSDTVKHHLKLFLHLPSFPIADEVIYGIGWKGGFWPSEFNVANAVERIGARPILFVAVDGDRRMPPSVAQALYARERSPESRVIVLPGHRHGEGFNQATEQYKIAVRTFLGAIR